MERHRELLGRYGADGHADTEVLCGALEAAHLIARLAPATLADTGRRSRLADVLADGRPQPRDLLRQAEQIRDELGRWHEYLQQPRLSAAGPALAECALDQAAGWLRTHVDPFEDAADLIHSVSRVMDEHNGLTLARARDAVRAVVAARAADARLAESEAVHRKLLGALYHGTDTDRDAVLDALDWAQKVRRAAHGGISGPLPEAAARMMLTVPADASVAARDEDWRRQREAFLGYFDSDRAEELRRELGQSLTAAESVLSRLDRDPSGPEAWTACAEALTVLRRYHLDGLPDQLAGRDVPAEDFPAAVERAVLTAWVEHQLAVDARLRPMRSVERDQLVERFRSADRALVEAAHAEVIAECNARRPRRTTVGQAAVIRRQAELQRRHMPVRHLLKQTQDVVRLIKPCFMMSPLTVSQFLPPDFVFDVVIFDEASQVLPQDAVNSVYRGKALIVAGDPKQLPPTSFFSAGGDSDDDDEWDEEAVDSYESILDMCRGNSVLRGMPLRWHYRSRHENLIAFSNHEFYDDTMVTFPGALEHGPDVGVEFFKADGVYDRGGRSDNPGEAAQVARRVIHHFETRPGLTLGVVALSKAQAEAIEAAVEKARAARPDLDRHFTDDRLDGFFVKNLETVQGDERDVIILSIGYGPDQHGKLRSSFGPINKEGGWRRLNVAVTRARRRMEVVASFYGGDLPDSGNKSVQHLKRYLQYAQHGPKILRTRAADPDAAPESPFEEEVLDVLRGWGYSVQPQVGVAGFRIDMAVRHPAAPGTYALGIECDGAMYHSSRAARDRDRLREAVLRDLGWRLHRIWGTDWYRNRRDAMARLRAAVETACATDPHAVTIPGGEKGTGASDAAGVPSTADTEEETAEPADGQPPRVEFVAVHAGPAAWSRPYQEADLDLLVEVRNRASRRRGLPTLELQDPEAIDVVADVAQCVIDVEGPVEEEVIFARVRLAWGVGRAGPVVRDRIGRALGRLVHRGLVVRIGTAYDRPGRELEFARTPTERCGRRVAEVPAPERQFVIRNVVEEGPGVHREDLLREAARFFGWARLGSDIRDALTSDIDKLIADGTVVESEAGLMPAEGA
jgi:very-short-patch-repair endonuclease